MGIGTSSSSGGRGHAPYANCLRVHRDGRRSWGGLPAAGRGLSSVPPEACHLIVAEGASGGAVACVRADGLAPEPPADRAGIGPVWLYNEVPACRVLPWRGSKEVRAI